MKDTGKLNDPKVIPIVDPQTGEELKLTRDGTFQNPRTKKSFSVTDNGFVVALKDPETKSEAHMEGNFLVSDDTGKKYPVTNKGSVMVNTNPTENKNTESTEKPQPQKTIKPVHQVPIEAIYNDYVYRVWDLISKESGVIVEFSMDQTNRVCSSRAISTINSEKRIIYAKGFQNTPSFQNRVLFLLASEFTKRSGKVALEIVGNANNYYCTIKNSDNDTINFINITENCARKLKYEVEKNSINYNDKKENPQKVEQVNEKDLKLQKFQFYVVTITIALLIIFCILGIVLLFG